MRHPVLTQLISPREADVAKAIVEFLALRGCFVYRQNAGGVVERNSGSFIRLAPEGASDWTGWVMRGPHAGKAIQCEIKTRGNKPTVQQRAWLELAASHGVIAFWANSVEMAEEALRRYGV